MPTETRFIADIGREAWRIQALVDRMLELTALESRKSLDHALPVPIGALLAEVANAAAPSAQTRGLRIEIGGAESPTVDGDAFLLQRAVANLVDNALDFSPTGGRVQIEVAVAELHRGRVTLTNGADGGAGATISLPLGRQVG